MAVDRETQEQLNDVQNQLDLLNGRLEFAERRVRAIRNENFVSEFLGSDIGADGAVDTFLDFAEVAVPANPDAGFRRVFASTVTNKLSVRTSGGITINLEFDGADAILAVEGEGTLDLTGDVTIANDRSLVIGHTAQLAIGEVTSELQILGTTETDASLVVGLFSATDALASMVKLYKSGSGSIGANFTTVADNEELGKIQAYGADGTDADTLVAEIAFNVDDSSIAAGQIGGEIILATATSGGVLTTALTISSAQLATFAGDIRVEGQDIQSNAGTVMITMDDTSGQDSVLLGNAERIRIGEVPGTSALDDDGIRLNATGSIPSALLTFVSGELLELGINTQSVGTHQSGRPGMNFRFDTRSGQRTFILRGFDGSTSVTMFQIPMHPDLTGGGTDDDFFARSVGTLFTVRGQTSTTGSIVDIQPLTANRQCALRVIPKGTPSGTRALFQFYATDAIADSTNVTNLLFETTSTPELFILSKKAGSGTLAPLIFGMDDSGSVVKSMTLENLVPAVDASSFVVNIAGTIVEAASGTHARLSGLEITATVITNAGAATTDAATVYISGAPTGITPTGALYALWVDAGEVRLDGAVTIQGLTVTLADAGADAIFGWDDTAGAYENLTQAEVLAVIGSASLTTQGVVELATVAETNTGTDATRAVTPDGLDGWTGSVQVVTVGALDAGSITANFGAIDNGVSNITTGGIIRVDVDGSAKNAAGSITMGAGDDVGIFFDGTDWVFEGIAGAATVFNKVGANVDFIIEGDTAASLFAIDAGLDAVQFTPTTTRASASGAVWDGIDFKATTATITGTTGITNTTGFNFINISQPTLTDASSVTVTNAATVYIANEPAAAGSVTITNGYALWVDSGQVRIDESLLIGEIGGETLTHSSSPTGLQISGNLIIGGAPGFIYSGANARIRMNPTASGRTMLLFDDTGATRYTLDSTSPQHSFVGDITADSDITLSDGGTVTQLTDKGTGVTLNTHSGQITMDNATLNGGAEVSFTVTNSVVVATDNIIVNIASGAGTPADYVVSVGAVAAGSFVITLANLAANAGEALVINFAIIGGSAT